MCNVCSKKSFVSLNECESIFGLNKKEDLKALSVTDKGKQKLKLFEQSKVIEYCLHKYENTDKIEELWEKKRKRDADPKDKTKEEKEKEEKEKEIAKEKEEKKVVPEKGADGNPSRLFDIKDNE